MDSAVRDPPRIKNAHGTISIQSHDGQITKLFADKFSGKREQLT